jgi:hypothetical protein
MQAAAPIRHDESSPRYFGWRVVVACFLMALACWGFGLYGHSVYLAELQRLHGWPPSLIAGASTATYLLNAVLVIFTSNALARFGARRFVLFGVASLAAALVLLALAREPWQVYAAYLGDVVRLARPRPRHHPDDHQPVVHAAARLGDLARAQRREFRRHRGRAGAGRTDRAPGFTDAMLIAAAVMVAILVPASSRGCRHRPRTPAPAISAVPAWTRRDALTSLPFWTVSGPFALALIAQVAFIVHQIAFMEPIVGRAQAAVSVSVMTAFAVIGRLTLGTVVDRLDRAGSRPFRCSVRRPRCLHDPHHRRDAAAGLLRGLWLLGRQHHHASLADRAARVSRSGVRHGAGLSTAIGTFAGALGPGLIGLIRAAPAITRCAHRLHGAEGSPAGPFVLVRKR